VNDNGARQSPAASTTPRDDASSTRGRKLTAEEILEQPHGLLSRGHLAELGLGRRAVDAVFAALDVVVFPNTRRPLIRAQEYLALVERSTYTDQRVR
jgi:hypothetical protein